MSSFVSTTVCPPRNSPPSPARKATSTLWRSVGFVLCLSAAISSGTSIPIKRLCNNQRLPYPSCITAFEKEDDVRMSEALHARVHLIKLQLGVDRTVSGQAIGLVQQARRWPTSHTCKAHASRLSWMRHDFQRMVAVSPERMSPLCGEHTDRDSHHRPLLRKCWIAGQSLVLFTLSCTGVDILRQIRHLQPHGWMAERCWLGPDDLHAHIIYGTSVAEDSQPLSQCMSDHLSHVHRNWIHNTVRCSTGTVLQRDYTKRYVFFKCLRLEWSIHHGWRTVRHLMGVHSSFVNELADLLGYCAGQQVLLHLAGDRMGSSSCAIYGYDDLDRSELPFR